MINRGYDAGEGEWSGAEGRAYFTESPDIGALKVSFFGPFYSAYNIIALDKEEYQWVMICGYNREYLWILSRKPQLEQEILDNLLTLAKAKGFQTSELIFVEH